MLADAHGNPEGLRRCLLYLQTQAEVDRILFLGDAVGYLPGHNEVIERLATVGAMCVLGNHDAMLLDRLPVNAERDAVYRIGASRVSLAAKSRRQIDSWPDTLEVTVQGRQLLLVHGSPWNPLTGYIYPDDPLARFDALRYDAVFMGHTHRPFIRTAGSTLAVNPGSCGLPRDDGSLASCAVYDTTNHCARIVRIPMDVEAICKRFDDEIHAIVKACLRRKPQSAVVGDVTN